MPYIADENEPGAKKWQVWFISIAFLLVLLFLACMIHITSGSVAPPTYMKSSDPYWYSGE